MLAAFIATFQSNTGELSFQMDNNLFQTVGRFLVSRDLEGAASYLERLLEAEKCERFSTLVKSRFSNPSPTVLAHINSFIDACQKEFAVKAVYLAHNGLVYNSDQWCFDVLAYDQIHDLSQDYEWLCHPRSRGSNPLTLTGLETVQDDFGWYIEQQLEDQPPWVGAADIAENLVKVRVVQLVQSALASGPLLRPIPVFATAYVPDFYCRFDP